MKTVLDRRMLLLSLALLFAPAGVVRGDDDEEDDEHDHDQARHAVEQGRARPLAEILARVRDRLEGEVVGVEIERENGRYVYEFKVITAAGRLREVYVDAMTAEILESKED